MKRRAGAFRISPFDHQNMFAIGGDVVVLRAEQALQGVVVEELLNSAELQFRRGPNWQPKDLARPLKEQFGAVRTPAWLAAAVGGELPWCAARERSNVHVRTRPFEGDVGKPSAIGRQVWLEVHGRGREQRLWRRRCAYLQNLETDE